MPWGYAAAAAGSYLANSGKDGGGTQTSDKSPWSSAQPWLTHNLVRGEGLQSFYQDNPFNALQTGAYANLLQGSDYVNQMVPGLLAQLNQPSGFDRNNPRARPQAMQFPQMQPMQQMGGLLGPSLAQANPWAGALQGLGSGIPGGAVSASAPVASAVIPGAVGVPGMPAPVFQAAPAFPTPFQYGSGFEPTGA